MKQPDRVRDFLVRGGALGAFRLCMGKEMGQVGGTEERKVSRWTMDRHRV